MFENNIPYFIIEYCLSEYFYLLFMSNFWSPKRLRLFISPSDVHNNSNYVYFSILFFGMCLPKKY